MLVCLLGLPFWFGCAEEEPELQANTAPVIAQLVADPLVVCLRAQGPYEDRVVLECTALDADGDSLHYLWESADGAFPQGNQRNYTFWLPPARVSRCVIRVTVDDGALAVRDSVEIVVLTEEQCAAGQAILPDIVIAPSSGTMETLFSLDASASRHLQFPDSPLDFRWDWEGDGLWDTPWSASPKVEHTFGRVDLTRVRLEVRDAWGQFADTTRSLLVGSPLPTTGIEAVTLPPGEFMMGPGEGQLTVIDHSFVIGSTEVSNAQYLDALNWALEQGLVTVDGEFVTQHDRPLLWIKDGYDSPTEIRWSQELNRFHLACSRFVDGAHGPGVAFAHGYDPADHPVVHATWFGAVCFADWLSMREGLPAYGNGDWLRTGTSAAGYRLPLPMEWEYAARYDDGREYPWGDQPPDCQLAEYSPGEPCTGWTQPVWTHFDGASSLGLLNLAGNAWEWVNAYSSDHSGAEVQVTSEIRGGDHASNAAALRATRATTVPLLGSEMRTAGFRVCRTVP
ncbi:MAG: SUMF1/EgtB/PvdO family nonheme iron enzyme [Calditrichaeota bacterium]|nr:SUMF1/EgtB/PvdO family nonheme iron enzyme [Calditrichota bacterium]